VLTRLAAKGRDPGTYSVHYIQPRYEVMFACNKYLWKGMQMETREGVGGGVSNSSCELKLTGITCI